MFFLFFDWEQVGDAAPFARAFASLLLCCRDDLSCLRSYAARRAVKLTPWLNAIYSAVTHRKHPGTCTCPPGGTPAPGYPRHRRALPQPVATGCLPTTNGCDANRCLPCSPWCGGTWLRNACLEEAERRKCFGGRAPLFRGRRRHARARIMANRSPRGEKTQLTVCVRCGRWTKALAGTGRLGRRRGWQEGGCVRGGAGAGLQIPPPTAIGRQQCHRPALSPPN
ncbi:hypothetical protein BDY21DRAFT_213635 [Lineolata rhizophorae]|uniref:Uncharacterized protein n=1 Tax=Lineolata rhizophorae TaxID=578093 RepID=A0A6A6P3S5_9PEZI|nr:hypothetical protein BDY21DRAFT_213635 [Lineolata rhizophorae]